MLQVWDSKKNVCWLFYCSIIIAQLISRPLRGTISNRVQVHDSAWPATVFVSLDLLCTTDRLRLHDGIIELLVPGVTGDRVALRAHEGVLCKSSDYIKRMIKPE